MDVFNHSFWKLYIKSINDLDPGLNLPERVIDDTEPLYTKKMYMSDEDIAVLGHFCAGVITWCLQLPILTQNATVEL